MMDWPACSAACAGGAKSMAVGFGVTSHSTTGRRRLSSRADRGREPVRSSWLALALLLCHHVSTEGKYQAVGGLRDDKHIYSEKNQPYVGDCQYGRDHSILPERAWIYANHEIAGILDSGAGWPNHPLPKGCIRGGYEVCPRAYGDIH